MKRYRCRICEHVYVYALGDAESSVPAAPPSRICPTPGWAPAAAPPRQTSIGTQKRGFFPLSP